MARSRIIRQSDKSASDENSPIKKTSENTAGTEGISAVEKSHNSLAKLDRYISATYVHSLKLGVLDYVVAVPALVCSTYVVPFLPVIVSIKMGTQRGMEYLACVLLCVAVSLTLKKVGPGIGRVAYRGLFNVRVFPE